MSALNPTARDLARLLTRHETRIAALEAGQRTSQLQHASLTGTAITVYDEDGVTRRGAIGIQPDGTLGLVAVDGPAPGVPTAPVVTPSIGGLRVVWDGQLTEGSELPADFDHVAVHVSTTSGFTPSAATFVGTITRAGQGGMLPVAPLPYAPHYVVLVAVNTSGISGDPSAETAATPVQVTGPDLTAGSVTAGTIAAGAVTADKLEAVLTLVTRLVAGDPAGARVELNGDGLRVYDSSGVLMIRFDSATGDAVFTGQVTGSTITGSTIETAASGQRVTIQPTGTPGENTIELYSGVSGETEPGALLASVDTSSGHPRPVLELDSPDVEPGTSAYLRMIAGGGTSNDQGQFTLSTGVGSDGESVINAYASDGTGNPGQIVHSVYEPALAAQADVTHVADAWEYADVNGRAFGQFQGIFYAPNMAWGRVTVNVITANTPASIAVTGLDVAGTTFQAYATALATSVGNVVTGVGAASISSGGLTVYANRTTVGTVQVAWMIIGV